MMKLQTIETHPPKPLAWEKEKLVDWTSGRKEYQLDGSITRSALSISYPFDAVKISEDGEIVVVYQKLGTKGLILKNGKILREINRSFYHANVYEYPIALSQTKEGKHLIIHCPEDYCKLEIEEAETGKKLTNHPERKAIDDFYSRLECNGKYLLSAGWVWHPYDILNVYHLEEVLAKPQKLDHAGIGPGFSAEISSARFCGDERMVIDVFSRI